MIAKKIPFYSRKPVENFGNLSTKKLKTKSVGKLHFPGQKCLIANIAVKTGKLINEIPTINGLTL
jgi:hypothetical protein